MSSSFSENGLPIYFTNGRGLPGDQGPDYVDDGSFRVNVYTQQAEPTDPQPGDIWIDEV